MKAIAGAAFAAVVACAGMAGKAEANTIDLSLGYSDMGLDIDVFTQVQYDQKNGGEANLTIYDNMHFYFNQDVTTFNISLAPRAYNFSDTTNSAGETLTFSGPKLSINYFNDFSIPGFAFAGLVAPGSFDITSQGFPAVYSADITFSPVPLPSAAYMFGAALLALGGIGYARRRITQPA